MRLPARQPKRDTRRRNATDRGYDYQWQQFRARFLNRYPLCAGSDPEWTAPQPKPGSKHIAPATQVHHIKKLEEHPELKLTETNCMPLCAACHTVRTRRGE